MNANSNTEHISLSAASVEHCHSGQCDAGVDLVADEVPVALEYNGISHAVMLASPDDLEDFALGFSLSEGILSTPAEMYDCEVASAEQGMAVRMRIAEGAFFALKQKRRNMTGRTGCGLCGAETLQQAIRSPAPVNCDARFTAGMLYAGMRAMHERQHLQQQCGGTHAAAWLEADGTIALVREDVGRHNALDKLIGALARKEQNLSPGAVLITSRASYEMVQKAATVGIGFVAAISAPTRFAISLAQQANVTLIGFVRERSHVVYAHGERLLRNDKGGS